MVSNSFLVTRHSRYARGFRITCTARFSSAHIWMLGNPPPAFLDVGLMARPLMFQGPIWVFPKIVGFPPKSSILIGFSIINHPFWGTIIFGNIYLGTVFFENLRTQIIYTP